MDKAKMSFPFITIADEFSRITRLRQELTKLRQQLQDPALSQRHSAIKSQLSSDKSELNFRLQRLNQQHQTQMTAAQNQDLARFYQEERAAAQHDPAPTEEDQINDELSSTKQHYEDRIKQELNMHHILPTRPEELYKVILIYLAIFKIHEGNTHNQQCDCLIEGIKNPQTRPETLLKAKMFFKQQKNPKALVGMTETIIRAVFGESHVVYLVGLLSRLITYPLSDILHFTGLHEHLPFPDIFPQQPVASAPAALPAQPAFSPP